MRKAALTISCVLLVAGAAIQTAAASEHRITKVHRASVTGIWNFRNAHNRSGEASYGQRNIVDFGVSGWDPSRPGDMDPSLNPSGS
jgi:hypothetical protein